MSLGGGGDLAIHGGPGISGTVDTLGSLTMVESREKLAQLRDAISRAIETGAAETGPAFGYGRIRIEIRSEIGGAP